MNDKKFLHGNNFIVYNDNKITYPYNAYIDIEEKLMKELKLSQNQIRLSLQYLYDKHPEMFKNKADIYKTAKLLIEFHQYAGDSPKNPDTAYLANKNENDKITDMAINRESGGAIHLNKNRRMSDEEKDISQWWRPPHSPHKQQVLGGQMNTSKEHFSPTNNNTISQNTIESQESNNTSKSHKRRK